MYDVGCNLESQDNEGTGGIEAFKVQDQSLSKFSLRNPSHI